MFVVMLWFVFIFVERILFVSELRFGVEFRFICGVVYEFANEVLLLVLVDSDVSNE
jgi:hypothetical protein